MMLDKIQQQNRVVLDTVKDLQGKGNEMVPDDDDMGVSIGNEIHHYHPSAHSAPPTPPPHNSPATAENGITFGKVAPWLLSGILGSALAGGGAAWLMQDRAPPPSDSPVIPKFEDTDTDTINAIEIFRPEKS